MRKVKWAKLLGVVMAVLSVWLCFSPAGGVLAADGADTKTTPTPTPIQDYVNKEQYLEGYYRGYVASDNSAVREGPGTKTYPILKLDDGTEVKLQKGTEVFVYGETKDIDLDVWYHIKGTFKNQEFEGYLYIKRVNRENTQIKFTPTPSPSPEPTPTVSLEEPTQEPGGQGGDPSAVSPAPTSNISDIGEKSKKGDGWKLLLAFCIVVIALIVIYTIFQRVQEKKLEEEMERYSKRRPAMERLDGEDEEDFKEAKKKYYASMNLGHPNSRKPKSGAAGKSTSSYDDDNLEDDFDDLGTSGSAKSSKSDYFDDDDFTDEDVKVVNDFRAKGHSKAADDFDEDFSEDDHAYFNRLKGKTEAPSENAIRKAGSAASILDESPDVDSYFEADEPTKEERLRNALDALKPEDSFVHKLYGEGVVIDNSDSEIIQVRFGRDLRFLKKDKIAKKELVDL